MRHQRAAITRGGHSYAPAILEEVDEEYVARAEEWEEKSEEEEVVSSDDDDDEKWRPKTRITITT